MAVAKLPKLALPDDMGDEENDEEEKVTLKSIQKLTGKLAQKIREFNGDEEEEMSSKDMKYVINSILSALDIDNMDENDIESIVDKLEGAEEDGMDDEGMGDDEMGMDDEEMGSDISGEEMAEGFDDFETKIARGNRDYSSDEFRRLPKRLSHDNLDDDSMSIYKFNKKYGHGRHRHDDDDNDDEYDLHDLYEIDKSDIDDVFDNIREEDDEDMSNYPKHGARRPRKTYEEVYSESKVDKVLEKYFKPGKTEKLINEQKRDTVSKVKSSSTNVVQEMVSLKTIKQYPNIKFLGKTKNNNLVFEHKNERIRITPKGDII